MTEVRAEPLARFAAVDNWLETPFGKSLLAREARLVEESFDGIFGEQCLQLGIWGEANTFLKFARTQRSALIADWPNVTGGEKPGAIGHLHRLPVATDSVDAVLMPHTLDYSDNRSHAILREADRERYLPIL